MNESNPPRIIIVDDEVPQMKALCDTLREQGYEPAGFNSPSKALEALCTQKFDLLLTDLKMPEMDGIGLLRAAWQTDRHLAAIVMTGHGTIDSAVEAMKAGAFDYILKPFKLNIILPVLSRALAMRRLRLENEELQQRVRERSIELENANRELDAFAHSVSHDLRAPVRAMGGFSKLLLDDSEKLSEEDRDLLQRICENAKTMGALIDGLLNLSRLGRQTLAKQMLDVDSLVRQIVNELSKEHDGRQVEVLIDDLPACNADPILLKQVFVNLISNAFKYSRQRDRAIVEVGCQTRDNECVYFVRDNGAGFDMRYAQKLFGVFQRMHRNDEFEGTGVGLSIVQRIIQRHGGRIWAEAEVDKGATFYFTLP